jgi:glycine betaine/proline transport system permease protein
VGLNQTIMLSLSMVVISSLVGANGLGTPVLRALASVNAAKGFESGFVIVVLAIVLRSIFQREVK